MNIPNLISLLRIFLIPIFLFLIFKTEAIYRVWALVIFLLASLTDLLDGWSARKLNQITATGRNIPRKTYPLKTAASLPFIFPKSMPPMATAVRAMKGFSIPRPPAGSEGEIEGGRVDTGPVESFEGVLEA